ncbi:MAG TPA: class I SAM-dependent methyltransferase [Thermoanaerobaculia bacterium]|jgi:SAM-dependent methyltransferase
MANTAAEFWDTQKADPRQVYWLFHPEVRAYVNRRMTGAEWGWPQLWLKSQPDIAYQPLARGISIGCGEGNFERTLRNLDVVRQLDAFDVAPAVIRRAKALATREGIAGIRFRVADMEKSRLPKERYDFAAFSHSLHHVSDPDALLAKLERALKPGGILYVDDYVGPSRDEWQDERRANEELPYAREEFETLPDALKLWPLNPPLDLADPSEMIRSDRIVAAIESRFEIVRYAPYWGNFLFPILCAVDGTKLPDGQIRRWIEREEQLVANGAYTKPLFAFFVGRRR